MRRRTRVRFPPPPLLRLSPRYSAGERPSGHVFDDLEQLVDAIAVAGGRTRRAPSGRCTTAPRSGGARDGDAAPAAEFEDPFVAQQSATHGALCWRSPREPRQRPFRRGEAVAGLCLAVCDRAADLAGNLLVEVGRIRTGLNSSTLNMVLVIIARGVQTESPSPPSCPDAATGPAGAGARRADRGGSPAGASAPVGVHRRHHPRGPRRPRDLCSRRTAVAVSRKRRVGPGRIERGLRSAGSRIAFVSFPGRRRAGEAAHAFEIIVINADGSGRHTVVHWRGIRPPFGIAPSWSPDGKRLVFDARSQESGALCRREGPCNDELYW